MPTITPETATTFGIVFLLLGLSAFFSGSETALTATSRARMHKLEGDGNRRARAVNTLISDPERLIGGILLGNNIVNILATSLTATTFLALFGEDGTYYATIVMTALVVVFAEVMPKTLAYARADSFAMFVAPLLRWVVLLLAPIIRIVQMLVRGALKLLFGVDVNQDEAVLSANEELRGAIDLHHKEDRLDKESRDLIRGALELDEIRVEEVMIHRKSIEMIDADTPVQTVIETALNSKYTRIPVYQETPDNIVGVLHAKDLSRALWECGGDPAKLDVLATARDPYFVPETTTLSEQLENFRRKQEHFALVVDEYGALQGLCTLEDILEEIVGEIEDEYDNPVQGIRPQADGSVNVDGDVTIRDLNRIMDWALPDDEAVTIAGLIIHDVQSIPDVDQSFSFHDFKFTILRRRRNQITGIKMMPLPTPVDPT
ncbi:MAG: HlyC/CorC family transporter [Pseudomonadota bacterium]